MPVEYFEPLVLPETAHELVQVRFESKTPPETAQQDIYFAIQELNLGVIDMMWHSSLRVVFGVIPTNASCADKLRARAKLHTDHHTYERCKMKPQYLITCITDAATRAESPPPLTIEDITERPKKKQKRENPQAVKPQQETTTAPRPNSPTPTEVPQEKPAEATPALKTEFKFRPRRHPGTYQPATHHSSEPVSCLLFRPQGGASLNKISVAKALYQLTPRPVAIRKIRQGGLAVDFPLGPLDDILKLNKLAGTDVIVAPPLRRQGSSGVIRGDFLAAEEVFELYAIHEDNPPISKVEQLGDKPVFRLFFENSCPATVTIFYNQTKVEPYFQHPIRCFKCQAFNHRAADCKRPARCSLCADPDHTYKDCPNQLIRCANCGGPHPATSKTCPHRLFHLSVAKSAAASGITQREARAQAGISYAAAVKKHRTADNSPSTSQTENPSNPVSEQKSAAVRQLLTHALSKLMEQTELDALISALQLLLQ